MSWLKKLTEGLKKTSSSAKSKLSGIFIGKKIDADTMESLEEALISSDLGVSASQKIVKEFEKNYSGNQLQDAIYSALFEHRHGTWLPNDLQQQLNYQSAF